MTLFITEPILLLRQESVDLFDKFRQFVGVLLDRRSFAEFLPPFFGRSLHGKINTPNLLQTQCNRSKEKRLLAGGALPSGSRCLAVARSRLVWGPGSAIIMGHCEYPTTFLWLSIGKDLCNYEHLKSQDSALLL